MLSEHLDQSSYYEQESQAQAKFGQRQQGQCLTSPMEVSLQDRQAGESLRRAETPSTSPVEREVNSNGFPVILGANQI